MPPAAAAAALTAGHGPPRAPVVLWLLLWLAHAAEPPGTRPTPAAIPLNPSAANHTFHGHGALSAGASSRLLHDYAEPARSDLLDLLFKPQWGAGLQVLKVEIGGDTQSTDGTEPSHMHDRGESSRCWRGYEAWLISEAKARNPGIALYALSWGVPGWVGNGSASGDKIGVSYCSDDNIAYQTGWVECIQSTTGATVDYLGVWNEMTWCGEDYVLALRTALDRAGHTATKIVLPDGSPHSVDLAGRSFLTQARNSSRLREAAPVMGFHYPCDYPPLGLPGMASWASEDFSQRDLGAQDREGGPGWTSGSYWGRKLNQNFVTMNMTTTIAWALIWSALPGLGCEGDGLTLANHPWSGYYEVDAPLWTTAHWTQFVKPGWKLMTPGAGSGFLPSGGSFVTALQFGDDGRTVGNFSIVLETLTGARAGPGCPATHNVTGNQTAAFALPAALASAVPSGCLRLWRTTRSSMFAEQPPVCPTRMADGSLAVSLDVGVDAMYTLTTVVTGAHGRAAIAPGRATEMPLPFSESFEAYENDTMARYFSDQGGSFSVSRPAPGANAVYRQWVRQPPGTNSWGGPKPSNPPPTTLIGGASWHSYEACVDANTEGCVGTDGSGPSSSCFVMLCAHASAFSTWSGWPPSSLCLRVNHTAGGGADTWGLVAYQNLPQTATVYASGTLPGPADPAAWRRLCLGISGCGNVTASVDGAPVLQRTFGLRSTPGVAAAGRVALTSGWHPASFDNLTVRPLPPPPSTGNLFECVTMTNATQGYVGYVGGQLTVSTNRTISAVARYCGGPQGLPPAPETTEVVLAAQQPGGGGSRYAVLASARVNLTHGCARADGQGFVWSELPHAVRLRPGTYLLAFGNRPGQAFYGTAGDQMPALYGPGVDVRPIYTAGTAEAVHNGTAAWTLSEGRGHMYGPLNARE